jgi:formylmethanofuran:tetrahydromethanopterin formyltransferase
MVDRERVLQAIFNAVDQVNQQLPKRERLEKSVDTYLFGDPGNLSSLNLVNLIVATEQEIEDELGVTVTLAGGEIFLQEDSPFETIGTFADYITLALEEESDGRAKT